MDDRIKLAEWMGYEYIPVAERWLTPDGKRSVKDIPDPFTDANDDYAVLEWYRSDACQWNDKQHNEFCVRIHHAHMYQVGDYARAALVVLQQESADE